MWKCKHCNEDVEDNFDVCWNCGTSKKGTNTKFVDIGDQVSFNQPIEDLAAEKAFTKKLPDKLKYPFLKFFSKLLVFFAIVFFIVSVFLSIIFIKVSWIQSLLSLIGGIFVSIIMIGISELIRVFIDIEFNTRRHNK